MYKINEFDILNIIDDAVDFGVNSLNDQKSVMALQIASFWLEGYIEGRKNEITEDDTHEIKDEKEKINENMQKEINTEYKSDDTIINLKDDYLNKKFLTNNNNLNNTKSINILSHNKINNNLKSVEECSKINQMNDNEIALKNKNKNDTNKCIDVKIDNKENNRNNINMNKNISVIQKKKMKDIPFNQKNKRDSIKNESK